MAHSQLNDIWKTVKGELEIVANPAHFKAHVPGSYIKSVDEENKIVEITSPSEFQRNFLEERLYGHFREVCAKVVGPEYRLMFSVTKKEPSQLSSDELGPLFNDSKVEDENIEQKTKDAGLYNQFTLDRFIVGNNNRLSYAVATAIADAPGKVYNPFFLHSGVGLGKTHLVQAIGHEVLKKYPDKKILYKTGEQFLNEVVEAVSRGRGGASDSKRTSLKKKYRNVDVLIVDDIHAIAGKSATQDEFFHTFNALYMAQKQIILTSDRAPREIRTLEERLSSRFGSGMIADIQAPEVETKVAILLSKSRELGLNAPKEVLDFIANQIDTNIRELQARLLQISTQARETGENLTTEFVAKALGTIYKEDQKRITPNKILKEVSKFYGITIKDIKGNRRLKPFVIPRQISMYLLRDMTEIGFQSIGALLGGRDHSTVLHGVAKVDHLMQNGSNLKTDILKIRENIMHG